MPGTANGDPMSYLQEEGSLAGFETLEALLEVHTLPDISARRNLHVWDLLPSPCISRK